MSLKHGDFVLVVLGNSYRSSCVRLLCALDGRVYSNMGKNIIIICKEVVDTRKNTILKILLFKLEALYIKVGTLLL